MVSVDIDVRPSLTTLQFEGVVLAVLAALFASVWLRSREAGIRSLALGFAAMALWYLNADQLASVSPKIDTAQLRIWSCVISVSVMTVTFGVVQYLGAPSGPWRVVLAACWLPGALLLIAITLTTSVSHRIFHSGSLLPYIGTALLAFHRGRQQPGDGHMLLGAALLTVASTPYILAWTGHPNTQLKYYAGAAAAPFGMVVLTVSLLRRQRALDTEVQRRAKAEDQLREANAHLEARVTERTAHLHELVCGLETFNRSVSHDLRGPLGGMSSLAQMAADALANGDPSMARRALPLIVRQCDASVSLVATMLDLARLGDMKVQPELICVADLVHAAFDEIMLAAQVTVKPELHCGTMPAVMADPRLLRPVLVNLIGNAVKFSRVAAQPRIDVNATVHDRDLEICVRDNGVGMAAGVQESIFDPFFRAHGAKFEGHGLGLSIVRRAVQAMGGRTWAELPPHGGAALCFSLPGSVLAEAAHENHPTVSSTTAGW